MQVTVIEHALPLIKYEVSLIKYEVSVIKYEISVIRHEVSFKIIGSKWDPRLGTVPFTSIWIEPIANRNA
jgi:hypothetical protein